MNILVVEQGTIDCIMNMIAGLVKNNHRVYVLHRELRGQVNMPEKIDLVITVDWLGIDISGKTIFDVFDCPIINISLGNSIHELLLFPDFSIRTFNDMCSSRGIYNWIMCPHMQKEYSEFGFKNSFYAPWGTSAEKVYFTNRVPDSVIFPNEIRIIHNADFVDKTRQFIFDTQSEPSIVRQFQDIRKLLFMGESGSIYLTKKKVDGGMIGISEDEMPKVVDDFSRDMLSGMSRMDFVHHRNIYNEIYSGDNDIDRIKKYTQMFSIFGRAVMINRNKFVKCLYDHFGDDFVIYGDGWELQGVKARPSSDYGRNVLHSNFPITLDTGSTAYECAVYPRPMQVISNCGFVMQLRNDINRDSSDNIISETFFNSESEMIEKAEKILADGNYYHALKKQQSAYFLKRYDFSIILEGVLTATVC